MKFFRAVLVLALALTGAARAQPGPPATPRPDERPIADPDATLVEELVVTARYGGPAWWKVSDADTTVYVLGAPGLAPKRQQWDQKLFERRLRGANVVILPYRGLRVRVGSSPGLAIAYLKLKSSTPFETTLSGPLRARFVAAREALDQPAKRYGTRNALAAGLMLGGDYRDKHELTTADPMKLIRYLAQQAKVPIDQRTYDVTPLLARVAKTPTSGGMTCLEEVLGEAEAGPAATLAASRAWAQGDVPGALAAERSYERCLAAAPGALAFDARTKADQADAIAKALKTPGHAIALVPLRPLLSQGGVLDRLRAQGFTVKTPGEE